jgi:hypothetical protein
MLPVVTPLDCVAASSPANSRAAFYPQTHSGTATSRNGDYEPYACDPDTLCALASRQRHSVCDRIRTQIGQTEKLMYFGGILGTILIIALIVYFVRRV